MTVVGHAFQRSSLERILKGNKIPSSLLFHGNSGIGKLLVGKELAISLLCDASKKTLGGCASCSSCLLFKAGNHPDFIVCDLADRQTWSAERFRELLGRLQLKPFRAGRRIVILNNAESISIQAANALLKTLEEPSLDTHFILISANQSRLPQTILSRCQQLSFAPLKDKEVKEILEAKNGKVSEEEIALADGSFDNLANGEADLEIWSSLTNALIQIAEGDALRGIALARDLTKDRDTLRAKIRIMQTIARRQMRRFTQGNEDNLLGLSKKWSLFLANTLSSEQLIFERNLGAPYVLTAILSSLADSSAPIFTYDDSLLSRYVAQ